MATLNLCGRMATLLTLVALVAPGASGEIPAVPGGNGKAEASAAPAAMPAPAELRLEIRRKLEDATALRDRLASEDNAPEFTPEDKALARRQADLLVYIYQVELETLSEQEAASRARDEAKAKEAAWSGFDQPPPYSVLMLDDLQDALDAARTKIAAFESAQVQLQRDAVRFETDARQEKAAVRLAAEAVEKAKTPEDAAKAKSNQALAQLRQRVTDNRLAWSGLELILAKTRLETSRSEAALLHRQIAKARDHGSFTPQDLEGILDGLRQSQQPLEQEQQSILSDHERWSRERDAAARALQQAKADAATPAPETDAISARLRAADAWLQTLRFRSYAVNTIGAIGRYLSDLWKQRYLLVTSSDPETRRQALDLIGQSIERLQPVLAYLDGESELAYAEERGQAARLDKLQRSTDQIRGYEQSAADAYRARLEAVQKLRLFVDRTERTLQRWRDEHKVQLSALGFEQRLGEFVAAVTAIAKALWQFELFAVDDSIEIEGKAVAVSRSVTFGKSVGAVLLFLLGYWLSGVFTGRIRRTLISHFGIDPPQANLFRRWLRAAFTLVVLLVVLDFMSIPLTAFAFLGGALAIGVGFGTQTLLKNFISGALILFERKIKVGDIVEVDGIVGTVTDVDVRSSTVRGFDGVETMIPNSTFLENKVTNWTYTTPKLRRSVKIGVAYGSPSHRVSDILLECAGRHGLILDDPAPFVWFEDFGENSLVFGLYYWLEMHPSMSAYQIASDLRFMIEKRFAEDGITLAFPQRDVHLDSVRPLQIEMVPPRT
ncbi:MULTISPECIES: mechanosensitive ion channel domain-containing protein [Methylococcus]|uniref:Mechanosensitive ion channel n=1 Tax=Methylococcus capsulatus TaxID=414 RepID=A0ABZ2F361_METCP|nr:MULTISPECIES: mechanosensitive ion channel domain-containing protein [Methylococcus]